MAVPREYQMDDPAETRREYYRRLGIQFHPDISTKKEDYKMTYPHDPNVFVDKTETELEEEWSKDISTATVDFDYSALGADMWEFEQAERLETEVPGEHDVTTLADGFAAAFRQHPEIREDCISKDRKQFFQTILDSPNFNQLHNSTIGNVMASDMFAVTVADQYNELQVDQIKTRDARNKLKERDPEREEFEDYIQILKHTNKAIKEATKEIEIYEDMIRAFGNDPSNATSIELSQIKENFTKIKSNAELQKIINLAGRYRLSAQAAQRNKVKHGYDDVVGIELGADLGRMLPLELAKFVDPDFELDAMRRFIERQSMIRQYHGLEKQDRGPIVVCLDESGSMAGDRIANAKAFALAMFWIARKQKRQCILVSFHCGTDFYTYGYSGQKNAHHTITDWLVHFYGGGTDLVVPCMVVPSLWENTTDLKHGKTDMIIVTDAALAIDPGMKEQFLKWKKKEDVKVQTIVIGARPGVMGEISESVHCVNCMSVDDISTQNAFSI